MLVQGLSIGRRHAAHVEDDLPVRDTRKAVRSEVMRPLLRDDDEVGVCDAVPVYQVADALKRKDLAYAAADALSDGHDVRRQRVRQIGEMVDVTVRNDETFSGRGGLDGHEGRHELVAIDEARRRTLRHDLAEDARHFFIKGNRIFDRSTNAPV